MDAGEVPAEGWHVYLKQEEARLLAERYQCPRPPTPIDPAQDVDSYLDYLVAVAPGDTLTTQLQVDWNRFVTFGERLDAAEREVARSPTPSPIMGALNRPMGWPMTRHPSHEEAPFTPPRRASRRASQSRASLRQGVRHRLQTEPLHATHQGRAILALATRSWYEAPSGFAVTQYAPEDNIWRANDEANYLHWLERDIRVHRSTTHHLLCVENIDALNEVLADNDAAAIVVKPTPPDWLARWGGLSSAARGLPTFLRAGYSRRNQLGRYIYRPHTRGPLP